MHIRANLRTIITSTIAAGTIATIGAASPAGAAPAKTFNCNAAKACVGGTNAGTGIGLSGTSNSSYGIAGYSTVSAGVMGISHSGMSAGIFGTNDAGGTGIRAVTNGSAPSLQVTQSGSGAGLNVSSAGLGIDAQSSQGDGIDAFDGGTNTAAVVGDDTSGGGTGSGVWGYSVNGYAGMFTAAYGNSAGALEVYGGTRNQTYAVAEFHDGAGYTRQSFDDSGNLFLSGQLYSTGSCRYGCSKTRGVLTYTQRTAEPTLSDDGEARLANGETHVQLDPAFANVMENQTAYIVTVTPEGPTHGLYVAQRDAHGFIVRENPPAVSTVTFGYHIVARPYGVSDRRLPSYTMTHRTPMVPPSFTGANRVHR